MPRRSTPLPDALEAARKRFEDWRANPERKKRIPDELWSLAIGLAGEFGTYRTARALRLQGTSLKKRAAQTGTNSLPPKNECESAVAFREVRLTSAAAPGRCVVELEGPTGIKMRLHLGAADAADFAHNFFRGQA